MTAKPGRREIVREATLQEIKRVAQKMMEEQGAGALSLRAIAAEMGMSAPALYNYYESRDDLLTTLIVDAYSSLGDTMRAACFAGPAEEYARRFIAGMVAYRDWALQNTVMFELIYGTPIPGYKAPQEITTPVAARALEPLVLVLAEAWRAGKVRVPEIYQDLPPTLKQYMQQWGEQLGGNISLPLLAYTIIGWGQIQGLVSLEIYRHTQDVVGDPGELYNLQIKAYLSLLGLKI
jgi:AcrR family transcriptional regulator